jgi:hypothetical protein
VPPRAGPPVGAAWGRRARQWYWVCGRPLWQWMPATFASRCAATGVTGVCVWGGGAGGWTEHGLCACVFAWCQTNVRAWGATTACSCFGRVRVGDCARHPKVPVPAFCLPGHGLRIVQSHVLPQPRLTSTWPVFVLPRRLPQGCVLSMSPVEDHGPGAKFQARPGPAKLLLQLQDLSGQDSVQVYLPGSGREVDDEVCGLRLPPSSPARVSPSSSI